MDKELIERLALEAAHEWNRTGELRGDELYRFAALIAEECAKIAEMTYEGGCDRDEDDNSGLDFMGDNSADAIRKAFKP